MRAGVLAGGYLRSAGAAQRSGREGTREPLSPKSGECREARVTSERWDRCTGRYPEKATYHRRPQSPSTPDSSTPPLSPAPQSSIHSAGLKASVLQSLPSARGGSFLGGAVGRPRRARGLGAAAPSPAPGDPRRGLPAAGSPGAHLAHRGGRTGRGTCSRGEGPSGLRGRRPRVAGLGGGSPGRRAEARLARGAAAPERAPGLWATSYPPPGPLPTPSCRSRSARLRRALLL